MATSNTYLSSKAQLDYLLSDISFVEILEGFIVINQLNPIYTVLYNSMNNYLLDIDPKFTIEIITSDGYLSYSNKLSQSDALKAPNQNTSPEVMAAINFL